MERFRVPGRQASQQKLDVPYKKGDAILERIVQDLLAFGSTIGSLTGQQMTSHELNRLARAAQIVTTQVEMLRAEVDDGWRHHTKWAPKCLHEFMGVDGSCIYCGQVEDVKGTRILRDDEAGGPGVPPTWDPSKGRSLTLSAKLQSPIRKR